MSAVEDADAAGEAAEPELIVYAPGDRRSQLAWRIDLHWGVDTCWRVVVDAHSGVTLAQYNTVHSQLVQGSGVDLLGATRQLDLWSEGGLFYTTDTSKMMYDPTSDPPEVETSRGVIVVKDAENMPATNNPQQIPPTIVASSTQANSGMLPDAVSAAANLSSVYDYFLQEHGRNSLDGNGGSVLAIVRLGQNFDNAFFVSDLNLMAFGTAQNYAAALDVVAHELAHGVTASSSNLVYMDQPGALNEAMSDIFGEMVEEFVNGQPDWIIGSSLDRPFRNMQDPSSLEIQPGLPYPERFSEFINTTADNGGVHLNSSIINFAFYQLAAGLPGAIGTSEAARIFYRANTVYLTANSQFIDARIACIQSAEDLFGVGSPQAVRTAEAFDFVEIFDGDPTPDPAPVPGTEGPDATMFLFFDPTGQLCLGFLGGICLGREDPGLGDGQGGIVFNDTPVTLARPSISGDGSIMAYVRNTDVCLADPAVAGAEQCLGLPGIGVFANSVSISPLADKVGFVLLDSLTGQPQNVISVFDITTEQIQDFPLVAPALDGTTVSNISNADIMNFSIDGGSLIYDAFNVVQGASGTFGAWSIYALDLSSGTTFSIVPPIQGLQIGNPSLAKTSDAHLTFEVVDDQTGRSTVYASNLETGALQAIGESTVNTVPSYAGDDSAIVYTLDDGAVGGGPTNSGSSLVSQPVANDRITPTGNPTLWVQDAGYGVVYRRGAFDTTPLGECEDGVDNDGDGDIDFPADLGCTSADDPLEVPEPTALVLQLAALGTLAGLRRRRSRAGAA